MRPVFGISTRMMLRPFYQGVGKLAYIRTPPKLVYGSRDGMPIAPDLAIRILKPYILVVPEIARKVKERE